MLLMAATSAELEIVRYKEQEVGHATGKLIYNFAEYSNITGTETWKRLWVGVIDLIKDHEALDVMWRLNGLDVHFSYFLDPVPIIREGELVLATPEPQITFFEKEESLLPSQRSHVRKIAGIIAWEMESVYHLRVERYPLRLFFPKEEYAKSIDYFNVALLQPVEINP